MKWNQPFWKGFTLTKKIKRFCKNWIPPQPTKTRKRKTVMSEKKANAKVKLYMLTVIKAYVNQQQYATTLFKLSLLNQKNIPFQGR